jgi:tetratricopeptide (TPR) repeat protein
VRLQCQAASSLVTTGDPRGLEYIRDALQVLDPVAVPMETANALSTEARFHHLAGRHKKAIEILMRATELVEPTANSESVCTFSAPIVAQVYSYMAGAHQHYGLYTEADRWAKRAIDFGTRHNVLYAEAAGYEFLGEDAVHRGDYKAGLEYAEREIELAEKLHSRERRAWVHFYSGLCRFLLGQTEQAELEFLAGMALAESIGENRVWRLMGSNLAVVQAALGRPGEALRTASEHFAHSSPRLLYSHFEALRCMAEVRFRRGEVDEAEQLCRQADELVSPTESRVSRLWLGPLHIDILVAQGKLDEAREKLNIYQELVDDCQSPRFTADAARLRSVLYA